MGVWCEVKEEIQPVLMSAGKANLAGPEICVALKRPRPTDPAAKQGLNGEK